MPFCVDLALDNDIGDTFWSNTQIQAAIRTASRGKGEVSNPGKRPAMPRARHAAGGSSAHANKRAHTGCRLPPSQDRTFPEIRAPLASMLQ